MPGHCSDAAALALGNRPARRYQRGSLLYQSAGDQPQCRTEKILETGYRYALTLATRLTFDYQYLCNPGYNAEGRPATIFAGRTHRQFWQ